MKNQYFGDINDYRKYGLLRAISRVSDFRTLVAWMLTPDDGSTDGKFTKYLTEPEKWSKHDPDLYSHLSKILNTHSDRKVEHIENTGLLENTEYYSYIVPDNAKDRDVWFSNLLSKAKITDLVFLDPDNGIEIKSKPYGRKNSSKFLFWREVSALWGAGNSLLIYQHFIRENRISFIQRMLETLKDNTDQSFVEAFSTPHVAFLLALQPEHQHIHKAVVESVQKNWSGQIKHWDLIRAQQGARVGRLASLRRPTA
jgi:hypothetical protein